MLIMNTSYSTLIQHVFCVRQTLSPLFLAVVLLNLLLHPVLLAPATDDQHLRSLNYTVFVAKLSTE